MNTEEFIKKSRCVHGDKYIYTKTKYVNSETKVCIICPEHGEFWQTPSHHIHHKQGCPGCNKSYALGNEKFIVRAKEKHGGKYDYSKVEYKNNKTKVCIICPEHGEFWQTPHNHLNGAGCPKCGSEKSKEKRRCKKDEFIKRSVQIHGKKYDYSLSDFQTTSDAIPIICHEKDICGNEHGIFYQTVASHLSGQGCPKCAGGGGSEYKGGIFLEKMKKIHPNLDFSKSKYMRTHDKIEVVCHCMDEFGKEHGSFFITPHSLLEGYGCKKCTNTFLDRDLFIERANKIHDAKYDYSKVEYKNNHEKVCIICPEHGEFWQIPNSHLNGRGCPFCKTSHIERSLKKILDEAGVDYIYQYHNKEMFDRQSLDFYLPDKKLAIECQSEIHYISNFFKSKGKEFADEHLEYRQGLDERKRQVCKDNGIDLIYFMEEKFLPMEKSDVLKFSDGKVLLEYLKSR